MKKLALLISILLAGCNQTESVNIESKKGNDRVSVLPASDQLNQKNWVLNTLLSDEFNGDKIDTDKWYVQGTDQQFYIWKGRAPSQFAPHNVSVSDGKLKLTTQWQPDYDFVGTPPKKQEIRKYENITTAAVISHNTFLYGYMEVKVKIPDAAMTGAFWGTGYQQELDIFELIGKVKTGNRNPESRFVTSIHDWRPGHAKKNKVWKHPHQMDGRTADAFHVYGVEWLKDGLNMYLDGKLIHQATQDEMGDAWVLNNPMELWFDSEIFPWHGIPTKDELPVDYEIEYVRVWQHPSNDLLATAFFGFEGPWSSQLNRKPMSRNIGHKDWFINEQSKQILSIVPHDQFKFHTGRSSLKFTPNDRPVKLATIASPKGSVQLASGKYQLSLMVLLESNQSLPNITAMVNHQTKLNIKFDRNKVGEWQKVEIPFELSQPSGNDGQLSINFMNKLTSNAALFIDDIQIIPAQ